MIPSQSYIRKDVAVTVLLIAGTLLLGSFRPQNTMTHTQVQLEGTLNSMGGAEFTPQMNPLKPYAEITLKPASDDGWDVHVKTVNLLRGEDTNQPNDEHLAIGYPFLIVDGRKIGRFYGDVIHLPELEVGEHIISVYYEFPAGGLYRIFGKPIGNDLYVTILDEDQFELTER
jgi:hypothetical protein